MFCPAKAVTRLNIECNIMQNVAPTVADPEGLIPGWTSLTY
jgi:hypothetical protein